MEDNLDKLFVSNEDLKKDLLFELLKDKIKITEDGEVIILGKFDPSEKIILYCLAKKVLFAKNKVNDEPSGPAEISKKTGLPNGTSKVYARKLEEERILVNKGGKYYIPNFMLHNLKERLKNG
mgnify:CR=1 FL=1